MKGEGQIRRDGWMVILLVLAILVADQIIKIVVKTNMSIGESIYIADWFQINFIENKGMAYGMTFLNKVVLSVFRIIASGFIGYYIYQLIRQSHRTIYILFLSMVLAGALGNLFDSMFYGLIFTESTPYSVSHLVSFGEGYAPFLMGKVVDMFFFPLIVTTWPDWMPFWGGEEFIFFSPVFNLADASISVGVVLLLIFCRKDLEGISNVFSKRKTKETE